MAKTLGSFFSLYLATLVLLLSSGLFNTYLGLHLTAIEVSETWVGAMIASYYLGLVFGARFGHKLIINVGHIRAYAASGAVTTITILLMVILEDLWLWLTLRFIAGTAMVCLFIAIESWLNEQTENAARGTVFAFYMIVTFLGTAFGQLALGLFPKLDYQPLIFVAICTILSLIPITLTRKIHPALQVPAPLAVRYYLKRVPMSITVLLIAGMLSGSFYGLAPVYGKLHGMDNIQVGYFIAISVAAGMLSQWPVGWLADRFSRVRIIRIESVLLLLLGIPLWGWQEFSYPVLLFFSAAFGVVVFTLYPLGTAFANDNVDTDRRVGLSALLYMVYGLGACVGPLIVGFVMRQWGSDTYFVFVSVSATLLVVLIKETSVVGDHVSEDAPTQYVPMSDTLQNSHVMAVLDPRIDIERDVSHDPAVLAEDDPLDDISNESGQNDDAPEHAADDAVDASDGAAEDKKTATDTVADEVLVTHAYIDADADDSVDADAKPDQK